MLLDVLLYNTFFQYGFSSFVLAQIYSRILQLNV